MMAEGSPAILPAKAPLPQMDKNGITVVSFNVLLPNGNDGWWIYKNYQPHVPQEHRSWPYRQSLLKDYLLGMDADVVCIQEASAETFESDFNFMAEAGYNCVLHSKFRFRSATFFRRRKLELVCEKHKDRVLVTGLQVLDDEPSAREGDEAQRTAKAESKQEGQDPRLVMVANCHLSGGPAPERRMRQVFDALDTVRKETAKLKASRSASSPAGAQPAKGPKKASKGKGGAQGGRGSGGAGADDQAVPIIVCGDFNSDGKTAVWELLTAGAVTASFREEAYPEVEITSKDKKQPFGTFGDLYDEAYGAGAAGAGASSPDPAEGLEFHGSGGRFGGGLQPGEAPPPTFMAPLLHPHFLDVDGKSLSPRLRAALSEMFDTFAREPSGEPAAGSPRGDSEGGMGDAVAKEPLPSTQSSSSSPPFLPRHRVEAWLLKINGALGRGSEFRAAEALMGRSPEGGLTLEDFLSVYAMELAEGKFWGVAHDLHVCGAQLPGGVPWVGPYVARLDHIFYSKRALQAVGAAEPLSDDDKELVYGGDCLPNSWHPSDHVAIGGVFRFR